MIKKNTEAFAADTPQEQIDQGRRWALRAGGALLATAAGVSPDEAGAQDKMRNELDRILREKLLREAGKNPQPVQPAPIPAQRQPGAERQEIAPQTAPTGAFGVDLENDENLKKFNPAAYAAYQAMSDLIVVKEVAAFKPMPNRKQLDEMSHTDREKLINARNAEILAEQKARDQAMNDFVVLYNQNRTPPNLEGKKKAFEDAIGTINALNAGLQAEVLGRLVRDVKEINDNGSKQTMTLAVTRSLLNIFPQARNISVKYRSRPTLGASNAQSNAFDFEVPVASLKPKTGTITEYLTENSVMMTKLARGNSDMYGMDTAHGMDKGQVQNMLANNSNQRGTGRS